MKTKTLAAASFLLIAVSTSHATTLGGFATVDNTFTAYLSTNASTLGTPVGTSNNWPSGSTISGTLTPGQTYFLQIVGTNEGLQAGFLGDFTLSDSLFRFANGTQTLLTNTTDWKGNLSSGSWTPPTGTVVSEGANGVSPWGPFPQAASSAVWIWPSDAFGESGICQICTVDFMTTITANSVSPVPLPGALPLFATGLGALGLLGWRRKRKAQAV